ncbi:helix-turn-helix transcriptional regulator [Pimelobacter simplex]|uniref:helix-turn-helix transcriptional regulator n=1 Tax=Nocardioides simplex TaxID=2045 RepID=UPI0021501ECE|nr:helix-turn-helix transcriptional regulator [Pimelobacter simplex]UUW91763.1 helix-turn-helix transcriptional regulator [Pimelobacter simplex]UUW95591.1 helix-turn-helix transcriptional regulator [Pimelobacter simplex]
MASGLTAERVRKDVDVVAHAGLDLDSFLTEAVESVRRAVPWVSACVGTHDPRTLLLTSDRKFGHLCTVDPRDDEFGLLEYGSPEATSFAELATAERPAAGVHLQTGGDVARSMRIASYHLAHYGHADEARVVFREGTAVWGGMGLMRGADDRPFDLAEIEFLASLAPAFARGVRVGLMARLADTDAPQDDAEREHPGPAVVIIGAEYRINQMTATAEHRLRELARDPGAPIPVALLSGLVGAARRYARGESTALPRCRARTRRGRWLILQAGPLSGTGGHDGDVVITIEEARPPEIVGLVVAAFGLTPRERDVTQLVLQGVATQEIGRTLHLSAYTVQDHLKSVFDKAGVRSRRDLIARVFFDQYVPRLGEELGPSGWYA